MPHLSITPARQEDAELLRRLIAELAEYEKLTGALRLTADKLRATLFGPRPGAHILIARVDDEPVGYALYFSSYSTFAAAPGLYLEDLFVRTEHRSNGYGKALMKAVAQHAVKMGAVRLDWSVLDWNESAQKFYESLGATVMREWLTCRLTDGPLAALGAPFGNIPAVKTLKTERVTLRAGKLHDAPRLTELLQHPEISDNLAGLPWPYTMEDARNFLGRSASAFTLGNHSWLIDHPSDGVIGNINLAAHPPRRIGYLGYWLGAPYWGQGLMSEVVARVVQHGFEDLSLDRIEAEHFPHNGASGRVMEKAGLKREGVRKCAFRKGDQVLDLVHFGICRADYTGPIGTA
jgi:RimJ/RimL family protein N-acetyltransferase